MRWQRDPTCLLPHRKTHLQIAGFHIMHSPMCLSTQTHLLCTREDTEDTFCPHAGFQTQTEKNLKRLSVWVSPDQNQTVVRHSSCHLLWAVSFLHFTPSALCLWRLRSATLGQSSLRGCAGDIVSSSCFYVGGCLGIFVQIKVTDLLYDVSIMPFMLKE